MFVKNIGSLDKEKLLKSVPRFEEKRLHYFRWEKGNKISFAILNGKTQELLMNSSAWEILNLCNGERSIQKITEIYQNRYLYLNGTTNFLKDVAVALFTFDKLWALSWGEGGSPFMIDEKMKLDMGYSLVWAKEKDIRDIAAAYEQFAGETGYSCHNSPNNRQRGLSAYQKETVLRNKLFYYKEDFFVLENSQNQIVGVSSVSNNQPDSDVLEITTFIVPGEAGEIVLNGIVEMLKKYYIFNRNKLRMKVATGDLTDLTEQLLSRCRFQLSAVLENEYGNGNDLKIYDYYF